MGAELHNCMQVLHLRTPCFKHQMHLGIKDGMSGADKLLQDTGVRWRYFSVLADGVEHLPCFACWACVGPLRSQCSQRHWHAQIFIMCFCLQSLALRCGRGPRLTLGHMFVGCPWPYWMFRSEAHSDTSMKLFRHTH